MLVAGYSSFSQLDPFLLTLSISAISHPRRVIGAESPNRRFGGDHLSAGIIEDMGTKALRELPVPHPAIATE